MDDRIEWTAKDAPEILAKYPDEAIPNEDTVLALALAAHFGYETRPDMPDGPGYWALEPRCVLRPWYRKHGEANWQCLGCASSYVFDSDIKEAFMREFRAKSLHC